MPKILVVDDEKVLVKGIKFNLENEGYQVEVGYDGEQAVELAVQMDENQEETVMAEDYADTNVSVKVVKVIQSYAGIVKKTTWKK